MSDTNILEGVFAISKPPNLSSAQVLRDLQNKFRTSKTFAPLLEHTQSVQAENDRQSGKKRRRDNDSPFKMGHGGTLDPMATGVLIVGIGRGTKHLQNFLDCTKQYDTTVLFGKSTDTYDVAGKVVSEGPHNHFTRAMVEAKLENFRGHIKQVPPIYSALKINGIKAYDYARSGKELPRELESRDMNVTECTLLEYHEPDTHDFRWPAEQASADEKATMQRLMQAEEHTSHPTSTPAAPSSSVPVHTLSGQDYAKPAADLKRNDLSPTAKQALHTHEISHLETSPASAPAASIRLTVSSGFYVRSFAHDLGIALGSYGTMASLVRVRQGDYTLPLPSQSAPVPVPTSPATSSDQPPPKIKEEDDDSSSSDNNTTPITALTYANLEQGEDNWGPILTDTLTRWMNHNPAAPTQLDHRDHRTTTDGYRSAKKQQGQYRDRPARGDHGRRDQGRRTFDSRKRDRDMEENVRRRNSSSPE